MVHNIVPRSWEVGGGVGELFKVPTLYLNRVNGLQVFTNAGGTGWYRFD